METIIPHIPATSINSDIANSTAGTAFSLPYLKQGCDVAYLLVYSGSVSAVSVSLQVSMDNTNWATMDTSTSTSGEYTIVHGVVAKYIRLYHTSRTGGTNVAGYILIN